MKWACSDCGELLRGDARRVLLENLNRYKGRVWLFTMTAPGSEVLANRGECEEWNTTAKRRAYKCWQASKSKTLRTRPVLARVWQRQRRGAWHVHEVISAGEYGHRYALAMDSRAERYGFGFCDLAADRKWRDRPPESWEGYRGALYLSRYLETGVGAPWVSRRLTSESLMTMDMCRLIRIAHLEASGEREGFARGTSERRAVAARRYYRGRPLDWGMPLSTFSDEVAKPVWVPIERSDTLEQLRIVQ